MNLAEKALAVVEERREAFVKKVFQDFIERAFAEKLNTLQEWNGEASISINEIGFEREIIEEGKRLGYLIIKEADKKMRIYIPEKGSPAQDRLFEFNISLCERRAKAEEQLQKNCIEVHEKIKEGDFRLEYCSVAKRKFIVKVEESTYDKTQFFKEKVEYFMKESGFCEVRFAKGEWHLYSLKH